jgi:hypothetical protein
MYSAPPVEIFSPRAVRSKSSPEIALISLTRPSGNAKVCSAATTSKRADDGERDRQANGEKSCLSAARWRWKSCLAVVRLRFDDVHSDAAPGGLTQFFGGRQTGQKDQFRRFLFGHRQSCFSVIKPQRHAFP